MSPMATVPMSEAQDRFEELARLVEKGETVTLTRDGKPVADIVARSESAAPKGKGIDWDGLRRFKEERGIEKMVTYIAPDFDDPLPEDFLIRPLPED